MSTVTKHRADAPEGFFEAEAAGLAWLAEAAPEGGVPVVRVLDVAPGRLELERVQEVRPTPDAARRAGRALAVTHAAGAEAFGAPPSGWTGPCFIGSRRQEARPEESWGRFYAEQRVLPFARTAVDAGNLDRDGLDVVERACAALAAGAFDDDRPPARLHGDLWSGNVLFGADGVTVIDPAAHGGHPETDLAMLELLAARTSTTCSPGTSSARRPLRGVPTGCRCTSCTRSRCTPRGTARRTGRRSCGRPAPCSPSAEAGPAPPAPRLRPRPRRGPRW